MSVELTLGEIIPKTILEDLYDIGKEKIQERLDKDHRLVEEVLGILRLPNRDRPVFVGSSEKKNCSGLSQ